MWNEYMEWEEDNDQMTFYDDYDLKRMEEGRDPQWEDSQPQPNEGEKLMLYGVALAIGAAGYVVGNYVIDPIIRKIQEKKDAKTRSHETSEWVRANIKNKKQETTETLQGNDNSGKNSRGKTNS